MDHFDVIVIGRGLVGSAAGRHLALQGAKVAVIGPDEPVDHRSDEGVFGSHYDSGRIVRILDPIPYYAQIAKAAIERFRPLEAETGICFYHEVGYLVVSNNPGYLADMAARAEEFYPQAERIPEVELSKRFPYFQFERGVKSLYQATAGGHLDPRRHIAAQNKALGMRGGWAIAALVRQIWDIGTQLQVRTD